MPRISHYTLFAFVWCLLSGSAPAERIVLHAVSDRSARDQPNILIGSLRDGVFDEFLRSVSRQHIDTFADFFIEIRGALEFDLRDVPFDATITSATLHLQTSRRAGDPEVPPIVEIHGYSGNGVVELADFASTNLLESISLRRGPPLELLPYTIDATGFVRFLREVNGTHAGFGLRTNVGSTYAVASSEFGYAPWRPRLEIDFTPIPEPASAFLLAAGAAFLAILYPRWRKC